MLEWAYFTVSEKKISPTYYDEKQFSHCLLLQYIVHFFLDGLWIKIYHFLIQIIRSKTDFTWALCHLHVYAPSFNCLIHSIICVPLWLAKVNCLAFGRNDPVHTFLLTLNVFLSSLFSQKMTPRKLIQSKSWRCYGVTYLANKGMKWGIMATIVL